MFSDFNRRPQQHYRMIEKVTILNGCLRVLMYGFRQYLQYVCHHIAVLNFTDVLYRWQLIVLPPVKRLVKLGFFFIIHADEYFLSIDHLGSDHIIFGCSKKKFPVMLPFRMNEMLFGKLHKISFMKSFPQTAFHHQLHCMPVAENTVDGIKRQQPGLKQDDRYKKCCKDVAKQNNCKYTFLGTSKYSSVFG